MGVKGLWTLLDSTGRPVDLESLKGKVLAVDVSIWMNQAVRGVRDRHGNPIKAAHLVTLFHRVCKLLFYGIKPVFVFDGAAPLLKRRTLDERRQRKGDAERDSSRAAERLMKVLLKKEAVGAVLGRERVRSARGATDRTADADLFKLPALPQLPHSSSSEEEVEEVDEVGRADPATWRHQLQEDPGSVDVDSSDFKSLPSEIQHELLTDLREAHKRRRTLFQAMPEESVSFSNYQLAGLLQRSRLSRRIEGLQEEMSGSARALGHEGLAGAGPGQHVESQRVVSEETSHYILIQGPREPEGPAASEGTAPASPGGSSKSERPPGTLGRSAWSPAPVRASEPSPANGARAGTPCGTHEGAEVTAVEGSPAVGAAAAAVVNRSSNRGAVAVAMGLGQEVIAVAKRLNEAVVQRRLGEEEAVVVKEHLEEKVVAMERNLSEEEVVIKEHLDEKVVAMVKEEVMKRSPGKEVVAVETKLSGDAFDVVKSPSEDAITMQKRMDEKAVTTVTIQDAEVVVIERSLGDGTVGVEKSLSHGVVTMEKIIDRQGVATEKNLGEGAVVVKKNQDETAVAVAQSLDTEVVTMETSHAGSAGGRSGPHGVEGGGELDGGGRCGGVIAVAAGDPGSRPPLPTLEGPTGAASSDEDDEDFVEVSSVSDVGFERGEEEEEEKEEEDKVEGLEGDAGISVAESGGPSRCDPVTPGEQSPSSPSIPAQPPSPAFSPMTQVPARPTYQHARSWRNIVSRKVRFPIALQAAIRDGNVARVYDILGAAESGGGVTAERGVPPNPRQADEQEDRSWREALNLAIRMGSDEVLGALLRCVRFDFRQIHEALLVAVDTNQQQVVTLLLDRLDNDKALGHNKMDIRSFSLAIFDHSMDSSRYPPGVTPLTLASQDNLFDIVEVLLKKGHAIQRPHNISCSCLECQNGRQYDTLKFSLSRINTYRGLAGRPYLCLASGDAILGAFELSRELTRLARQEPEFKAEYMELDRQCEEFAVELLAMCQNQREVDSLLNDAPPHGDEELAHGAFEEGIPSLGRLRLAVSHQQKLFVSHPVCQQVLTSIWCSGMPSWRGSHAAVKAGTCLGIFLGMPLLALIYWIAPKSRLGNLLRTPLLKFLMHSASYLWFLFFLLVESIMMDSSSDIVSTRNQTLMDSSFHMVWVAGFLWYECKEVWIEGLRVYLSDWWNCLDLAMISMYISSFTLRLLVRWSGELACGRDPLSAECAYFTTAERGQWQKDDPQIIAEVVFAITSALSFTRLAFILPAHESLGTLQISIGKILGDIFRFMFLVMIIGTAFLCGINNLYVHYTFNKLGRFNETFQYLFWTVFGMEDRRTTDIPNFEIAQFVGRSLYGVYAIIMAIVLLNMLIAMITSSFERIEDDADVEWKFARSRLYLSYFREGLTLPVPFNLIPSPKSVYYAIMYVCRSAYCTMKAAKANITGSPAPVQMNTGVHDGWGLVEPRGARQSQVIRTLVRRYIDKARQEYEENKHKDLGFRVGELKKSVARMHGDIKSIRRSLSRARLGLPDFAVSPGQARSDGDTASYLHATSDGESPCSSASASQRGSFRFVVHEPNSPAQHRSGPAHDEAQHPRPMHGGGDSQRPGPTHASRALPSQQLGSRSPVSDSLRIGAGDDDSDEDEEEEAAGAAGGSGGGGSGGGAGEAEGAGSGEDGRCREERRCRMVERGERPIGLRERPSPTVSDGGAARDAGEQRGSGGEQRGGNLEQRGGNLEQRGGNLEQRGGNLEQRGNVPEQRGASSEQRRASGTSAEQEGDFATSSLDQARELSAVDGVYTLLFANTSWYVFLRLHQLLCARLLAIRSETSTATPGLSREQREVRRDDADRGGADRDGASAGDGGTVAAAAAGVSAGEGTRRSSAAEPAEPCGPVSTTAPDGPDGHYGAFLRHVRDLVDGQLEAPEYEERLREAYGVTAYVAYSMDRLLQNACRQLQHMVCDEACAGVLALYLDGCRGGASGGVLASQAVRAPLEASYQRQARRLLPDEHCYKVMFVKTDGCVLMTMELLDVEEDSPVDLQEIQKWSDYVQRYAGSVETSPVVASRAPVFLGRNLWAGGSRTRPPPGGSRVVFSEGLRCSFRPRSFRMLYVIHSEDVLYRRGALRTARQTLTACSERRRRAFRRFVRTWRERRASRAEAEGGRVA
ncbi:unnamed protein product [Lampetra planeri]